MSTEVNPTILQETLQTFMDLKWFSPEVLSMYKQYLNTVNNQWSSLNSAPNSFHFKVGILEELVKKYADLPSSMEAEKKKAAGNKAERKMKLGSKFISKFFLAASRQQAGGGTQY